MQTNPAERLDEANEILRLAQRSYGENPTPTLWKGVLAAKEAIEQATLAKEGADRKAAKEAEDAAAKVRADLERQLAAVSASLDAPADVAAVADKLQAALALAVEAGKLWTDTLAENKARRDERRALRRQLGLADDSTGENPRSIESRLASKLTAADARAALAASREALDAFGGVIARADVEASSLNEQRNRLRSDLGVVKRDLTKAENSVTHWERQLAHAKADVEADPSDQEAFKALETAAVELQRYTAARDSIAAQAASIANEIGDGQ